jgi:hypothetical protein
MRLNDFGIYGFNIGKPVHLLQCQRRDKNETKQSIVDCMLLEL